MKKVGIITIFDENNYGNRLQNYATQKVIEKMGMKSYTLKNEVRCNKKDNIFKVYLILMLKSIQNKMHQLKRPKRYKLFSEFNKNIVTYNKVLTSVNAKHISENFDFFVCGSDQIWNVHFRRSTYIDMLEFTEQRKKIAFSPSIGKDDFPDEKKATIKKALNDFKFLSVREIKGKEAIENLTNRNDVEVLIDPTLLLTSKEWDFVSKKPQELKHEKYILNYFLGEISKEAQTEIERIAQENDCKIINILDNKSTFFNTGPSEFLYLEKNAFLICTDSFHSCIFAFLYDRPFIVFDRKGNGQGMNSRIDTLIQILELKDRKFRGKISKENLEHNYENSYKILEKERNKSKKFLEKALNIKDSDIDE